jgi:hypothetical protein
VSLLVVPMDKYVADAFDGPPSLSSGLAHVLLTRSPRHAWTRHARLNPAWRPDDERRFDVGMAAHGVLLEGLTVTALDFPDYRSTAARAARDEAKAAGKLPVLREDATAIEHMVANARAKITASPDLVGLGPLLAEQTIRWKETQDAETVSAWLRCRPDWITEDHAVVLSVKTTRASAEPDAFLRTLFGGGYDMQMAFEIAGVKALTGREPKYVWPVLEVDEPYAVSLVGPSPALIEYGQQRRRAAVNRWAFCLAEDRWPAYPDRIAYVDPPAWAMAQAMEREAVVVDDGRPLDLQLFGDRA